MIAQTADLLWKVSLQAGILALVVMGVSSLARKAPAKLRHALWVVVLIKFLIPPFAHLPSELVFWQHSESIERIAASTATVLPSASSPVILDAVPSEASAAGGLAVADVAPSAGLDYRTMIVLCWLAGVSALLVVLMRRLRKQSVLLRDCRSAGEAVHAVLYDAAQELKIKRLPRLGISHSAPTAMLISLLRPTILLPSNIMTGCGREDIRAILLHELAHLKRWDLAVMWLHQLVQVFFFFHPAVWIAGRELKRERELACDELVLSFAAIKPQDYASGYLAALKLANGMATIPASLAMAEPFDVEKRRLVSMMNPLPRLCKWWTISVLAVVAIGLPTFVAVGAKEQTAGKPPTRGSVRIGEDAKGAVELLKRVDETRTGLLSQVRSGHGKIVTELLSNRPGEGMTMTRIVREAVFRDREFRLKTIDATYLINQARKSKLYEPIYHSDGETLTHYIPSSKTAFIYKEGSQEVGVLRQSVDRYLDLVSHAYPDVKFALEHATDKPDVIDGPVIDGVETTAVEITGNWPGSAGKEYKEVRRYWIAPSRNYAVLALKVWREDVGNGKRTLLASSRTELRRYFAIGDWLPSKVTKELFAWGAQPGEEQLSSREVIAYSPGFAVGGPVSEQMLKLDLPDDVRIEMGNESSKSASVAAPPTAASESTDDTDAAILAGQTAVEGPGVVVSLRDSARSLPADASTPARLESMIHDSDVRNVVNELLSAGAEAVSVGGERIVSTSGIRSVGPAIVVNGTNLSTPIVIKAIGDPKVLERALKMHGGLVESYSNREMISIERKDEIRVEQFGGRRFRWARPVNGFHGQ